MKPYYQDTHTTIYLGDCVEVLTHFESNSFDAVITDPPYCSGGATLNQKSASTAKKYTSSKSIVYPSFDHDSKDQRGFEYWCRLWLSQAQRVTKPKGVLCQFTDWRQLPLVTDIIQSVDWAWRGIAVWDKINSRPQIGKFRQQCEYVVWGSKGPMRNEGICLPGCFSSSIVSGKERIHQTQKPLDVMQTICKIAWRDEATILDPFVGSGSTLAAAKSLGKKAVGIEVSEHYAEQAAKRLQAMDAKGQQNSVAFKAA